MGFRVAAGNVGMVCLKISWESKLGRFYDYAVLNGADIRAWGCVLSEVMG